MTYRGGAAVVVLIVSLLAPVARATDVPAGTYSGVTWTAAGSPYHLLGTVSFSGLTIEAGTTVLITNLAAFTVDGLDVNGTRDNPVTFQPDVDTTSYLAWQGIWVEGSTTVRGAVLLQAKDGIRVLDDRRPTAHTSISETVFDGGSYAVIVEGSSVDIDAVEVKNSPGHGVWIPDSITSSPPVRITNSVFRGLNFPIYSGHSPLTLVNCTIDHGGNMTIEVGSAVVLELRNTLVTNGGALVVDGIPAAPPAVTIVSSDFWNSGIYLGGFPPPPGVLSVDPQYLSATDLHLAAGSPCIDAGTLAGAPDHDLDLRPRPLGLGVDIGAYEYDPSGGGAGAGGQTGGAGGGGAGRGGATGSGGASGGGGGAGGGDAAGSGGASGSGGGGAGPGGGGAGGGGAGDGGAGGGMVGGGGASGNAGGSGGRGAAGTGSLASSTGSGCGCRVVETPLPESAGWLLAIALVVCARRSASRPRRRDRD